MHDAKARKAFDLQDVACGDHSGFSSYPSSCCDQAEWLKHVLGDRKRYGYYPYHLLTIGRTQILDGIALFASNTEQHPVIMKTTRLHWRRELGRREYGRSFSHTVEVTIRYNFELTYTYLARCSVLLRSAKRPAEIHLVRQSDILAVAHTRRRLQIRVLHYILQGPACQERMETVDGSAAAHTQRVSCGVQRDAMSDIRLWKSAGVATNGGCVCICRRCGCVCCGV